MEKVGRKKQLTHSKIGLVTITLKLAAADCFQEIEDPFMIWGGPCRATMESRLDGDDFSAHDLILLYIHKQQHRIFLVGAVAGESYVPQPPGNHRVRTALHRSESMCAVGDNNIGPRVISNVYSLAEFRSRKVRRRPSHVKRCHQHGGALACRRQLSFQIARHTMSKIMRRYGDRNAIHVEESGAGRSSSRNHAVPAQPRGSLFKTLRAGIRGMIVGDTRHSYAHGGQFSQRGLRVP